MWGRRAGRSIGGRTRCFEAGAAADPPGQILLVPLGSQFCQRRFTLSQLYFTSSGVVGGFAACRRLRVTHVAAYDDDHSWRASGVFMKRSGRKLGRFTYGKDPQVFVLIVPTQGRSFPLVT